MRRSPLLTLLALALAGAAGAWLVLRLQPAASGPASSLSGEPGRIISLTPAITETLFALGAGGQLVARSDYCRVPDGATPLPAVGTSLTPDLERIARLRPSLVIGESNLATSRERLDSIAPTRLLPWLTVDDVLAGVLELGRLTDRSAEARGLRDRLAGALRAEPPPAGPRVLLAMAQEPGRLEEVWFFKRNSLHGAALHAAGGRNAVDEDVAGMPILSLERLIGLDPDLILLLSPVDGLEESAAERILSDWRRLTPLSAPRRSAVALHAGAWLYGTGPGIVDLTELLRADLQRLGQAP